MGGDGFGIFGKIGDYLGKRINGYFGYGRDKNRVLTRIKI